MSAEPIAPDPPAPLLLIVDDDPGIRSLLAGFLEEFGYGVQVAKDAADMWRVIAATHVDLIILDLMMPGEDGLSALRKLQADTSPPVIMLSAFGTDVDRIVGLEIGAEDFIQKPCNPRELVARIRTVLRRRSAGDGAAAEATDSGLPRREVFRFNSWTLDVTARVLFDSQETVVHLSDGEFQMLRAFVEHPNIVLSRDDLLGLAFGGEELIDRAVDVQVSRLRRKLASRSGSPDLIRTIRNEGYLFQPTVSR